MNITVFGVIVDILLLQECACLKALLHYLLEAVGVDAVHVRCECVLAGRLSLATMHLFIVGTDYLQVIAFVIFC